jgi:hypothetical protein
VFFVKTIFMALEKHDDHELMGLLTENLSWIKTNFSTMMMECVPVGYQNTDALSYFFHTIKTYGFNVREAGLYNEEEILFLDKPFKEQLLAGEADFSQISSNLKAMAFVERRIELLSRITSSGLTHIYNPGVIEQMLCIYKRYRLFYQCLEAGLELKGMEPVNYRPGFGVFDTSGSRDIGMYNAILEAGKEGGEKGIFMLVGASHAIHLIPALSVTGQFTASFVRLATSEKYIDPRSPFSQWFENIAPKLCLGHENYLTKLIIDSSSSKACQRKLLESSLRVAHGPALPPNLERNLDTGLAGKRH